MECPFCGSEDFVEHKRRGAVKCARCGSLERGRACYMLLTQFCNLGPQSRIAHFAPEVPISKLLGSLSPEGYERYDFAPDRYNDRLKIEGVRPVGQCDLCHDLGRFETGAYDLVLHNHVLEHVPCNYTLVLQGLHRLLKPGGIHVFSVPKAAGYSREDLTPTVSREERRARYGQFDHLRAFGLEDFFQTIGPIVGIEPDYNLANLLSADALRTANIGEDRWSGAASVVYAIVKSPESEGRRTAPVETQLAGIA